MVIAAVEFERALIVKGVEIMEIRKFGWNGNSPLPSCLSIENLDFMALRLQ